MDKDAERKPPTMSAAARRLIERSRKLAEQQRQNLIDQIGRFGRLDVDTWKAKFGPNAIALDTGHADEHGDEGCLVVVGDGAGCVVGYVWDATLQIKRWVSVRTLEACSDGVAASGEVQP